MTDEELIARVRDTDNPICDTDRIAASDRIEALVKENTALKEHVADMLAEQECGCGYDNPTDVCLGHLPLHRKTVARAEQLAATNEALVKERDEAVIKRAAWELEAKTQQARAERLEAALREIIDEDQHQSEWRYWEKEDGHWARKARAALKGADHE